MQVWRGVGEIPESLDGTCVTLGNFDGVHLGHQAVLAEVVATARRLGVPAVAITFDPHPAQVHRPHAAPALLTGLHDRLLFLEETGLDAVLVLAYSLEFAQTPAEAFVQTYLVDALGVRGVVVGHDARFGAANAGDGDLLNELGARHGFEVVTVADESGGGDRRWSSSWARELVERGDVAEAATVLGRPHRMRGVVVHGQARGRELGYPTANLSSGATGTTPEDGVYAGWLLRHAGRGDRLPAAISIGTNPTFDGLIRGVEAYVLGRDDLDLYGEEVVLEFVERLRPTLRFDGIEPLLDQMAQDVERSAAVLGVTGTDRAAAGGEAGAH